MSKTFFKSFAVGIARRNLAVRMSGKTEDNIPADVYLSFVRSLYGNRMTLRAGMIVHVSTCLLIYLKLGDPAYLVFSAIVFSIGLLRLFSLGLFDKSDVSSMDSHQIAVWEWRYIFGAGLATLMLGIMTGYSFLMTQDTFAQIATTSITLAAMVSVVGRNFGSKINVDIISSAALVPIMISLAVARQHLHGNPGAPDRPVHPDHALHGQRRSRVSLRQRHEPSRNRDYRGPVQCGAQQHAARAVHARLGKPHIGRQQKGSRASQGSQSGNSARSLHQCRVEIWRAPQRNRLRAGEGHTTSA